GTDSLWIVQNRTYASWYKKNPGQSTGRVGSIISTDIHGDIASAKMEILIPKANLRFLDVLLLKKVLGEWKIIVKTAYKEKSNKTGDRILMVVSNAYFYGDSKIPTGNSFSETIDAYEVFAKSGYNIDFVSPEGGAVSLAYLNMSDEIQKKYLYDMDFMNQVKNTKNPSEIDASKYKAIYFAGGGAAMFGVPENEAIQAIAMQIYEQQNGIISSICHGTAGIVNLKTEDGKYLVAGKKVSGYPDEYENHEAEYYKLQPFKITQTIKKRKGKFLFAPKNKIHVETDGRLMTGQNHHSAKLLAEKIVEELAKKNP
ncbi:MAG: putative intracellular protease/amidase, partial [Bacteroidia bacterium]